MRITEDEMALSEDNQKWVRDQISEAVNPNGWTRFAHWLRYWSLPSAAVAIVLTLVGIIVTLSIAVISRNETNATFRQHTEDRLTGIEIQMVSLRALIVASDPTRKQNQDAAKELIAQAVRKTIPPIPGPTVEETGRSFLQVAAADPNAWKVALDFVSYRSSQNRAAPLDGFYPLEGKGPEDVAISRYSFNVVVGAEGPRMTTSKARTPVNISARLEPIGRPVKQDGPDGPVSVLVVGGGIVLDGMYARHVIFEGTEIHYNGGPLIFEEVTFVNCRFVHRQQRPWSSTRLRYPVNYTGDIQRH